MNENRRNNLKETLSDRRCLVNSSLRAMNELSIRCEEEWSESGFHGVIPMVLVLSE